VLNKADISTLSMRVNEFTLDHEVSFRDCKNSTTAAFLINTATLRTSSKITESTLS